MYDTIIIVILLLILLYNQYLEKYNNLIILVSNRMEILIIYLMNKYMIKSKLEGTKIEEIVIRLIEKFPLNKIQILNPEGTTESAVTLNKSKIYLCVSEKSKKNIIWNLNTLTFVMLHEMSHIASTTWGHDNNFWRIHKFLLNEAINAGIYIPVNYVLNPEKYCNTYISYNPYYDESISTIPITEKYNSNTT